MTNTFQQYVEEKIQDRPVAFSSNKRLVMWGILFIALCMLYVISTRMVEASEYTLRDSVNSRDHLLKEYAGLGTQLDSLRSLSTIAQDSALAGFQEVQKPLYLNMDAAQSVAVAPHD